MNLIPASQAEAEMAAHPCLRQGAALTDTDLKTWGRDIHRYICTGCQKAWDVELAPEGDEQ